MVPHFNECYSIPLHRRYINDYQAKEFIHYIAEDERRKMRARLSESKFISVMSDGSLNSAVMEEEMIYIRSASEGKVKVDFVGVKAVSKPDATNIAEAVCSIMDSEVSTDWKDKLVALTIDGASVMTGVNNGVVTKLRADRPNVLGIHCMAHKLKLAFSDGIRKNVMVRKVEDLLIGLYPLYHKSGVNSCQPKATLQGAPYEGFDANQSRWNPVATTSLQST